MTLGLEQIRFIIRVLVQLLRFNPFRQALDAELKPEKGLHWYAIRFTFEAQEDGGRSRFRWKVR